MNCPFCNIDKEKTRILADKKNVFVIFSNPRLMPGHLLVVPKRHVEKISGLSNEEKKELFDTVVEFQERILSKLASGCDIRHNYRPFLKQNELKVNHLHIHLLPREFEDKLYRGCQIFETKLFRELAEKEAAELMKILKY